MAITVTLITVTPHRLVYRCNQDGAAGTTAQITNTGGATPDLETDADALRGSPIDDHVTTTVANLGQARDLFLTGAARGRSQGGLLHLTPDDENVWGATISLNGTRGEIDITGATGAASEMFLEVLTLHSTIR